MRQSARSQKENVTKVAGATSSEGFLVKFLKSTNLLYKGSVFVRLVNSGI